MIIYSHLINLMRYDEIGVGGVAGDGGVGEGKDVHVHRERKREEEIGR